MEDSNKYIIDKLFPKLLTPTTLSNVTVIIVTLVDVGLTSYFYGANGLTAVSLFIPLLTLWGCLYEGMGTGASALLAQKIGEGQEKEGQRMMEKANSITLLLSLFITMIGLVISFGLSASTFDIEPSLFNDTLWYGRLMLISTIPYVLNNYLFFLLRADSSPKAAALSNGIQVGLNILFDVLFMGVFDWGIKGAALALLVSSVVALSYTLIYLSSKHSSLKFRLRGPDLKTAKSLSFYSINAVTDNLSDFAMSLFMNVSVLVVFGIETASIIYVIGYIIKSIYYFDMSFTYSAIPVIGVYLGEKNNSALDYIAHKGLRYTGIFGTVMAVLIIIFAHQIAIYGFSFEYPEFYDSCDEAIIIYAFSIPFYMMNSMMICYCQQVEHFRLSLIFTVIRGSLFFGVMAFFTLVIVDSEGLWWGSLVSELVLFIGWVVYMNWKKRKIHSGSFLCLPHYESPYKAEVFYLILPDQMEQVEDYQEMVDLFLNTWHISGEKRRKAVLSIEEIMNFAIATKTSKHGYVDIRIGITLDENVRISAKMDNKSMDINAILKIDELPSEGEISLHVLRSLSSNFKYNRILSFNTINLLITDNHYVDDAQCHS